jgi:HEAT repeat protein
MPIVEKLLTVMDGQSDPLIRRKALEALGYSGHPRIPELIEDNYDYGDEDWLASVLIAMGRSADEQWEPFVVDKLSHSDNVVRLEAVRAAGELLISDAAMYLIELLNDEDKDIRMASAWSLSEIGGSDAEEAIEAVLEQTENEEEIEHLENALENLEFNEDLTDFDMFDFSGDEPEDATPDNLEEE